jgi:hypothetical protein
MARRLFTCLRYANETHTPAGSISSTPQVRFYYNAPIILIIIRRQYGAFGNSTSELQVASLICNMKLYSCNVFFADLPRPSSFSRAKRVLCECVQYSHAARNVSVLLLRVEARVCMLTPCTGWPNTSTMVKILEG